MPPYIHTSQGCWLAQLHRDDELDDPNFLKNVAGIPDRIYRLGREQDYLLHARLICAGVPHVFEKIEPGVWTPMHSMNAVPARTSKYFGLTFNPVTVTRDLRVEL